LCAYFLIVSNTTHTSFKMAQMVGGLKLHDQVDDGARAAFHAVEAQIKQQAGVRHASLLVEQCLFGCLRVHLVEDNGGSLKEA